LSGALNQQIGVAQQINETQQIGEPRRIAVLLTCFNRRDKTLRCLASLHNQLQLVLQQQQYQLDVFLLDNGSDGTDVAVAQAFPTVHIWRGQPDWYWNTGMLQLWQRVCDSVTSAPFAGYLWLNDDVVLAPDAISRLLGGYLQLSAAGSGNVGANVGAIIGSMAAPAASTAVAERDAPLARKATYGGRLRSSRFNAVAFGPVLQPGDVPQRCDFINGNLCFIPAVSVEAIGLLSSEFTHGLGDFDYGLRLQAAGFSLWVGAGFYGECATNPKNGSVFDAAVPLHTRLALSRRPNVLPSCAEWRLFVRRHGGRFWLVPYFMAYFRQLFPRLWLRLKQRQLAPVVLEHVQDQTQDAAQDAAQKPTQKRAGGRVLIVQQVFKQYRLAFFEKLAQQLAAHGVELTVAFSAARGVQQLKNDNINQPVGEFCQRVALRQFGPLVWQQVPDLASYDVVVTEQANRHLLNYLLLLRRLWLGRPKWVAWGHGFNHQAPTGLWSRGKEAVKRQLLRAPDAFFAYTAQVAKYVTAQGVAPVTVLNNSVDTSHLAQAVQHLRAAKAATYAEQSQAKHSHVQQSASAAAQPACTLLFCGSLYPDKQLPLLLSVAEALVRQGVVSKLIVLGDGPQRHLLEAVQAPWLDYRGACFAEDKARAFAEADVFFNPGLLGLAVLDAFAAGLAVITTDYAGHSPEIAYLQHGYNGLVLPSDQLISAMQQLLTDAPALARLNAGATASSAQYSVDAMVNAFVAGVLPLLPESAR
jgi:glycosyltransferase involved in cell wall biosynthesis